MRKLAIVILNWNGSEMMLKYLPSVIANSTVGDVIVADNASTDDSVQMLNDKFPDIRTIVFDQNHGFAEGYNRAIDQLKDEYEYQLLLNSDIEIRQRGWDSILVDYMDSHPECAAAQPKLLSLRRPDEFEYAGGSGGYLDKYGYPFCRGRIFATVEKDTNQYDNIADDLMWATGAALLVRTKDFIAAGGLDSSFFAHMEEIDLCWRLRIMGNKIACIPQSTAYHLGGASLNYGNPQKTYLNFRNNLIMLYKNLPEESLNSVLRIRHILDLVAAFQSIAKCDFKNAKSIFRANSDFRKSKANYSAERKRIQDFRISQSSASSQERQPYSILIKYYIKGIKTFSNLR